MVAVLAAAAGYLLYHRVIVKASGCAAGPRGQQLTLGTEQAAIAATIAGVAHARRLPPRAVTIAYAAAMQESHLRNLGYGDLDSLGVFQQRPSQGWGSPRQLTDPVYATGKFFAALVRVPDYLRLPLDKAAQDVQHSADGQAYEKYRRQAAVLTRAFTGALPHAVWCWYQPAGQRSAAVAALQRQLVRTFGRITVLARGGPGGAAVTAGPGAAGWEVASWLVTHAGQYRIAAVGYAGYQWRAGAGSRGWTRDPSAPRGSVELR